MFLSSSITFHPNALPMFLSHRHYFSQKSKFSLQSPFLISSDLSLKKPFFGQGLNFSGRNIVGLGNSRKSHRGFGTVRATVKWRKERPFDNVIQRDKKLKLVLKIRRILVSKPDRVMSLRELGRYRKYLCLNRKRKFIALLRKFPVVFEIMEEGAYSLMFKLTPEADQLYLEELKLRNQMKDILVVKLRKLLMMSLEKRILLRKISHLATDLGLPLEFRDTICDQYPQYFKVVSTEGGPALELTNWDPELAVSAFELGEEENRARELEEKNLIIDRPLKFDRVKLPKGLNLSRGEMRRIVQFRDLPYTSPYSDFSHLRSGTPEKEKHSCGVVHEILSLTVEKRTLVDHLTHFREEFRFSQQVRGMLIRHPDMFYVSLKGDRDSVFLREAYHGSELMEKDLLLLIKEKFRALIAVPPLPKRYSSRDGDGAAGSDRPENGNSDENGEEWSDINNILNDGEEEEDDEEDDDWSDEGDELPPDFDEDDDVSKFGSMNQVERMDNFVKNEEEIPVFPDGRPRERW